MKEHQCEYAGGFCIYCLSPQPVYNNKKKVGFEKVKPINIKKKNITSEFQYSVNEIMEYLHEDVYKKGNFSKYAGVIKRVGINQARIWIKEMKRRGISNPKYFFGIVRNFYKLIK